MNYIKLLVSIRSVDEVFEVIEGGADIIDIKDPSKGSLGLPDFEVVRDVVKIVKLYGSREVSMALGDIKSYDKSLKYIAFAGGILNINYIKIGMAMSDYDEAYYIAKNIVDLLSSFREPTVVLVGYADFIYVNSIDPLKLIPIAKKVDAKGVMIDTYRKNNQSTFDLLSIEYLKDFVRKAQEVGLLTAIAGSLKQNHIPLCVKLGFNVVGVRGAVCIGGRNGRISKELVKMLKIEIGKYREIS